MTRRHTWHGAYDAPAARWAVPEPTPLDPATVQLRRDRRRRRQRRRTRAAGHHHPDFTRAAGMREANQPLFDLALPLPQRQEGDPS
jgi:hypothetical protein